MSTVSIPPNPEERHDEQEDVDEQQPILIRASGEIGRGFTLEQHKTVGMVRIIFKQRIAECLQGLLDERSSERMDNLEKYKVNSIDHDEQREVRLRIGAKSRLDRRQIFRRDIFPCLAEEENAPIEEYEEFEARVVQELSRYLTPFAVRRLHQGITITDQISRYAVERVVARIEQHRMTLTEVLSMIQGELQEKYERLKQCADVQHPRFAEEFPIQPPSMHQRKELPKIYLPEWRQVMDSIDLAEEMSRGRRFHAPLEPDQLEIINEKMRVRLAGWEDDNSIDWRLDIRRFQDLESSFVAWLDELAAAEKDKALPRDQHELNARHYAAIKRFHAEGGHAGRLPEKKIQLIMQKGMILFIELEIAPGVFLPVGSVSALLPAPCSEEGSSVLDHDFPNYDQRDIMLSSSEHKVFIAQARKRIAIVRSSIRDVLDTEQLMKEETSREILKQLPGGKLDPRWEGMQLRRMGFAARGKDEIFHIALRGENEEVTYNIGRARTPAMSHIEQGRNNPSHEHNSWNTPVGWRTYSTPLGAGLDMSWMAYNGRIAQGILAFEDKGGILEGKGYDLKKIEQSTDKTAYQIICDRIAGRRGPMERQKYSK